MGKDRQDKRKGLFSAWDFVIGYFGIVILASVKCINGAIALLVGIFVIFYLLLRIDQIERQVEEREKELKKELSTANRRAPQNNKTS